MSYSLLNPSEHVFHTPRHRDVHGTWNARSRSEARTDATEALELSSDDEQPNEQVDDECCIGAGMCAPRRDATSPLS